MSSFTKLERENIIHSIASTTGLSLADATKVFDAIDRPAKRDPLLRRQWVENLDSLCKALVAGKCRPVGLFETAFWIRLYGVITELRESFTSMAELHKAGSKAGKDISYLARCAEVFAACTAVRDSLTDEELVYAAYLRHVHAHVTQSGFEIGLEGKPPKAGGGSGSRKLRTKQMVRPLSKHVPIDRVHEIVDQISMAHGNNGGAVATQFAAKVSPAVARLRASIQALDETRKVEDAKFAAWVESASAEERER